MIKITSFLLKVTAVMFMIVDHIGKVFYPYNIYLTLLGKISFPIFAFQITQSYANTKSKQKFIYKLLFFAFISQIPFSLMASTITSNKGLNVLFTYAFCLIAITILKKNLKFGLLNLFLLILLNQKIIRFDYGIFAIILIFNFYYLNIKNAKKIELILSTISICFLKYIIYIIQDGKIYTERYLLEALFTSLAIIPICMYNKKEGIKCKYLFYIIYPLHMLLIYLIYVYKTT